MKIRTKTRLAGAIVGVAMGASPQLAMAEPINILSPGLVLAKHWGQGGDRYGLGFETTYHRVDRYDLPIWSSGGFLQLEFFEDGAIRLAAGHQLTGPFAGIETGPSLVFGPEGDVDVGFQFGPWIGVGIVNVAGRIIPRLDGLELGAALTLKAPLNLDDGDIYVPTATAQAGRPVRDASGSAIRPGVVAIGRRPVPDAARRLPDPVRVALGRAWLDAARDEHAAITAFTRLASQLSVHEAPATLIADARRAAADEDRHARTCFAIAGALLGLRLRPVATTVPLGAVPDRAEMAAESVIDGEFNEGAAAHLAALGADAARIAPVRDALSTIAVEEEQHAALARRVRVWAESTGDLGERRRVRRRVDAARAAAQRTITPRHRAPRGAEHTWAAWGQPTEAHAHAVTQAMRAS